MRDFFLVLNAFIEDTCVLMVIAYLLARGHVLDMLVPERHDARHRLRLGIVMGLIGLSEVVFPGARAPYVAHTLLIAFATLVGGIQVGLIASLLVSAGVLIIQSPALAAVTLAMLAVGACAAALVRRAFGLHRLLLRALAAGAASQIAASSVGAGLSLMHMPPVRFPPEFMAQYQPLLTSLHVSPALVYAFLSVPANGFGALLLQLVLNDALTRSQSERHRLEAQRAHTLVSEAKLSALRARVHPHFLFNALTSIAALCHIDPIKAEGAILRLGQLMRTTLDMSPSGMVRLADEIEAVRAYLEIEQNRLGSRLTVRWSVDPTTINVEVPPFCLQTMVENAIIHGIAPSAEKGILTISVRSNHGRTVVAVRDNGMGMDAQTRARVVLPEELRPHGLQIQCQLLMTFYGRSARIRIWSRPDIGTLVTFGLPASGTRGGAVYEPLLLKYLISLRETD
jgi:LytS/YehU family sensor histidine kinase